jgi:acetyl esterase/lipase
MKTKHLVEPEALAFIEQFPRFDFSVERLPKIRALARTMMLETKKAPTPGVTSWRSVAPGHGGTPDVPVVVYMPDKEAAPTGALLYIHGGGYVMGDVESEAPWCEWLVAELGCIVVSPEYRLAPETPHPGPITDCYTALKWLHDQCDALRFDRRRMAVYGESAGGGLAAALALLARDRKEIELCFQCLQCPMLDDQSAVTADPNAYAGEYVWTQADNHFGWSCLLGHEPGRPGVSAYASPARATELAGLPPTFIWVGALDLFVDESIEYARRLVRAGVPTELRVYPGVTHGNLLVSDAPSTKLNHEDTLRALRKALATGTQQA